MGKLCVLISFVIAFGLPAASQTYTHPTTGIANEFVGSCMTATCSGTYTDNGGASGNYSNGINNIYRVFCPNAPGQCVQLTFTSFNMEGMVDPSGPLLPLDCYFDYLSIGNGATQNAPVIDQAPSSAASTTGYICGTPAVPFTYTATNPSGCLTVRMNSDGTVNGAGWTATISCVPCAGGPSGTSNSDCVNATLLCSNASVPANSTGPGIMSEACTGTGCPAGGENYSNWYIVQFQQGGTFTFNITPSTTTDDYDYAVYGPNVGCNGLGSPLRCSDSGLTGATGLTSTATDFSESVTGDKFTAQMNVLAGESYYIMVDEWTPTGAGYSLTFGGTAVMSCSQLVVPVNLVSFEAEYIPSRRNVELSWLTLGEQDNAYFEVQRSIDGEHYEVVDVVSGSGTTFDAKRYTSTDYSPFPGEINYYRLKQVDGDGDFEFSWIQAVAIYDPGYQLQVIPNPARENAELHWINAAEGAYQLDIYDCTIKSYFSEQIVAEKGRQIIPLDLSSFPKGVYFITLRGNGEVYSRTFVRDY
jgi:hypothetical protein